MARQSGMRARHGAAAMALLAVAALAGCGGRDNSDPLTSGTAPCPRIVILAEGADLTRFREGAPQDLTGLEIDARITGFEASCDYASRDRRALEVRVTPAFSAERGPAASGRSLDLGWFVAMTDAGDTSVLDRQGFSVRLAFAANAPRATASGPTARLRLPIGDGVTAQNYIVRLSLQLTPQELATNRARGPR